MLQIFKFFDGLEDKINSQRVLKDFMDNVNNTFALKNNMDYYVDKEKKHNLEMVVNLKPENIDIKVKDNTLIIEGKEETTTENEDDKKYFYKSISKKSFKKEFYLNENFDQDTIEAKVEDGILKITFKEKDIEKDENVKKIEIK